MTASWAAARLGWPVLDLSDPVGGSLLAAGRTAAALAGMNTGVVAGLSYGLLTGNLKEGRNAAIKLATSLPMALAAFSGGLGQRLRQHGIPALQLQAGSWTATVGDGHPAATVSADPYELGRALSGRRSARQVERFAWQGDPAPYLPVFSMFGALREDDLDEQEVVPEG